MARPARRSLAASCGRSSIGETAWGFPGCSEARGASRYHQPVWMHTSVSDSQLPRISRIYRSVTLYITFLMCWYGIRNCARVQGGGSSESVLGLLTQQAQRTFEGRNVELDGSPKDIKVNKEISVNEAISHARHK